jgi:hypothetical protein
MHIFFMRSHSSSHSACTDGLPGLVTNADITEHDEHDASKTMAESGCVHFRATVPASWASRCLVCRSCASAYPAFQNVLGLAWPTSGLRLANSRGGRVSHHHVVTVAEADERRQKAHRKDPQRVTVHGCGGKKALGGLRVFVEMFAQIVYHKTAGYCSQAVFRNRSWKKENR